MELSTSYKGYKHIKSGELYVLEDLEEHNSEEEVLKKGCYIRQSYITGAVGSILQSIAEDSIYLRHLPQNYEEGHSECEAVINAECIYKLMKLAGTEESIGVETLDDYAVQKIIGWFQQQEDIDLELRSDIEFIYLPMLDEYSEVRPCALNTRLSLEPEYFCSLIELFYKERNGEKRKIELNKSLSDRLYEILFQFKVTPGIDWNGNFDAKRFDYWMKTVKTWSRDNDRYEVAMHTVGSGLSYAELDEDKLPQTAIIEELNRVENEELRRGYYLGIINQRGVHWIDPEGKPELELAEDYENRANIAESRGYSRYADILRVIADEFKREAKRNILEARNGDDE